ncbi:DUF4230 domain-containing protein [Winogradskyella sp. DF17]|uniref:DUF4230 domain-containing protein n=1 Tax=Winogradskyella pelagia TaxID=2819984 RepID=A0ABS3T2S5_9FLAO|nr:DUF4230 domain-containing protein [Winogradskyella sp. DF17]MBO3117045.1 DUF4230 domain-containing protein [Winogradskyella sp. DF17]
MRNFLLGILITVVILLLYKQCTNRSENSLRTSSELIQEQLNQVSKLVVTEGHFTEVFNYENSKEIFGDYLTADKKALVVVNAKISVSYDLSKLEYSLNEETKTIEILNIPEQEVLISPELEYYDMQSDFFNPFEAKDYNTINASVKSTLLKKIETSTLKTNAENRLISELAKFYILTESLGWTLIYKSKPVNVQEELNDLIL